jgi:hypothetical protein
MPQAPWSVAFPRPRDEADRSETWWGEAPERPIGMTSAEKCVDPKRVVTPKSVPSRGSRVWRRVKPEPS